MQSLIDNKDVIVYGVTVPGTEGKAGMAAIYGTNRDLTSHKNRTLLVLPVFARNALYLMLYLLDPDQSVDLLHLAQGLSRSLPHYAQPLFIRITKRLDLTGTYRLTKKDYAREGYDMTILKDDVSITVSVVTDSNFILYNHTVNILHHLSLQVYFKRTRDDVYKLLDLETYTDLVNGVANL